MIVIAAVGLVPGSNITEKCFTQCRVFNGIFKVGRKWFKKQSFRNCGCCGSLFRSGMFFNFSIFFFCGGLGCEYMYVNNIRKTHQRFCLENLNSGGVPNHRQELHLFIFWASLVKISQGWLALFMLLKLSVSCLPYVTLVAVPTPC